MSKLSHHRSQSNPGTAGCWLGLNGATGVTKTDTTKPEEARTHENGEEDAAHKADGKPLQPGVETQRCGVQDLREEGR